MDRRAFLGVQMPIDAVVNGIARLGIWSAGALFVLSLACFLQARGKTSTHSVHAKMNKEWKSDSRPGNVNDRIEVRLSDVNLVRHLQSGQECDARSGGGRDQLMMAQTAPSFNDPDMLGC